MQTVVIVNAGGWEGLSAEKGSYDDLIESFQPILDAATVRVHGRDEKAAEVHVSQNVEDALARLNDKGVLVFVTRGMLGEARRIKHQHPKIRVVVFTSDVPDDEVLIVDNGLDLTIEQLRRVILGA